MPELEANEIMRFVTGKSREELVRDKYLYASNDISQKALKLALRRAEGEPLAYIIGEWDFYGFKLKITPDVLIPRADTETLVDCVLRRVSGAFRFLDLGCGSGAIGIALASMRNGSRGVLADISDAALAVAKHNASENKLSGSVSCVKADMLTHPPLNIGQFDVIVSNPPYITDAEMREIDKSVSGYEPHLALCGGEDGLMYYRAIMENWFGMVKEGGLLAFECGMKQSADIAKLMEDYGGKEVLTTQDGEGLNRVVSCYR